MKKINLLIISLFIISINTQSQNFFEKGESQIFDFVVSRSTNEVIFPYDYVFKFIDIHDNSISHSLSTELDEFVTRMALNMEDSLLIAGFKNGTITIYDLKNNTLISSFQVLSGNITALAISPDNSFIAASCDEEEMIIYDFRINEVLFKDDHVGFISDMEFTDDNRYLVYGGQYGLKIIESETGSMIDQIAQAKNDWIRGISINSEKKRIFFAGDDGKISSCKYSSNGELSSPYLVQDGQKWISDLDMLYIPSNTFLYSTINGRIKINGAFSKYDLKMKSIIYRNKFIETDPNKQIRIAFSVKDKGLYLYYGINLNSVN